MFDTKKQEIEPLLASNEELHVLAERTLAEKRKMQADAESLVADVEQLLAEKRRMQADAENLVADLERLLAEKQKTRDALARLTRAVSRPPFSWYFLRRQKYREICESMVDREAHRSP